MSPWVASLLDHPAPATRIILPEIADYEVRRKLIGSKSYQTARYMCHRLRAAMQDQDFLKLMGLVEVDETYIGGKNKNRHVGKRTHGTGGAGKVAAIGAISRKGYVIAQIIERTDPKTLEGFVDKVVSKSVELVATDDAGGYRKLSEMGFPHDAVSHTQGEYVRGLVHTGTIDGFWAMLKRGIMGSYHHVSKKYLPLYLNEFSYRYNNRNNEDMFGEAIAGC